MSPLIAAHRALFFLICALYVVAVAAPPATAQPIGRPLDRPGERSYEPEIAPEQPSADPPARDFTLPREPGSSSAFGAGPAIVWIDSLDIQGNEAISDQALLEAARPFLARRLSVTQLEQLVSTLTRVYLDRGYANSGAYLPDQNAADGVLVVRVIEGRLGEIRVQGTRRYHAGLLENRLRWAIETPLRVQDVEEVLRALESDRGILRLDARLRPTEVRGVARLEVRVEEETPAWAEVEGNNYEPPSVGTLSGVLSAGYDNLLGLGDRLAASGSLTEGLRRLQGAYSIPIHPSGTTLDIDARMTLAEVVQPPFDELDVESEAYSIGGGIRQPLFRRRGHDLSVGLHLEHRWGKTSIAGRGVTFAPGADNGRTRLTLLRPHVEWKMQRLQYAFAMRSIFSFGLDLPSSTTNSGSTPDARFFAWLGQARGIYRHPKSGAEIRARLDVQLSDDALLPLEQFAVGGPETVRGYPRNLLVRDQAIVGSLDFRWPAWKGEGGRSQLMVGPFADLGRAWNRDRSTPGKRTLSSVGVGAHLVLGGNIFVDVEWGFPIRDVEAGDSLQGKGLLVAIRWSFP